MIFVSKFDIFKAGKTIYHIDRVVREIKEVNDNGLQEIYVNTKVDDGSSIAKLMKIYQNQDEYDFENFPNTSNRKKYFKKDEGEERLGDGILGNDKHRIVGAKVELLNEDGTLANLYQFEVTGGIMSVKDPLPEAVTYTNGDSENGEYGEYQFLGVIPGRYLIRYTYDANTYY